MRTQLGIDINQLYKNVYKIISGKQEPLSLYLKKEHT